MRYFTLSFFCLAVLSLSALTWDYGQITRERRAAKIAEASQLAVYRDTFRPTRDMDYYDVTYYGIHSHLDYQAQTLSGRNEIRLNLLQPDIDHLEFHLSEAMEVDSVYVWGIPAGFTHSEGILAVTVQPFGVGQEARLLIVYHTAPVTRLEDGLKFETHANVPVAFTMCSPRGARKWQPCKDVPWDKADSVDLWIRIPLPYTCASNGNLIDVTEHNDNTHTWHWHENHPITTYLVSFAATNYVMFEQSAQVGDVTMPIHHYLYPESQNVSSALFDDTPQMVEFFNTIYGLYPFADEKYGHAVCTDLGAVAMEHQTCTSFDSSYLSMASSTFTVAHELGHQWFGDYVSLGSWGHVWLKEGFATYSEALWAEHLDGSEGLSAYMTGLDSGSSLDEPLERDPEGDANHIFNIVVYDKGGWTLHMLRYTLGDENFFAGIREYVETYGDGSTLTSDLQSAFESVSGEDLDWFFSQWFHNEGRPRYEYALYRAPTGDAVLALNSISAFDEPFSAHIPWQFGPHTGRIFAEPGMNNFALPAAGQNDILLLDTQNWVLDGGFLPISLNLRCAGNRDGKVGLLWDPWFDGGIDGFILERRTGNGEWVRLTQEPVNVLNYLDENLEPGQLYSYRIAAVKDAVYLSQYSNTVDTVPVDFTLDQGILLVDRSTDSTTPGFPTDAMQDQFYLDLLSGQTVTEWSVISQGQPPLAQLARYQLVVWFCDDLLLQPFTTDLVTMKTYLLGGGKLILSGCRELTNISEVNLNELFGISEAVASTQANFAGAMGNGVTPNITVDPDKVPIDTWGDAMGYIYRFTTLPDTEVLFRYDATDDNPEWENAPCGVFHADRAVVFGFPLYFMESDQALAVMNDAIGRLTGGSETSDEDLPSPRIRLSNSPNPFNPVTTIRYELPESGQTVLAVYNIRGEKVRTLVNGTTERGNHEAIWDGTDDNGTGVASGVYLYRLTSHCGMMVGKMTLMK